MLYCHYFISYIWPEPKADDTEQIPSLSYVEPYWSGTPAEAYSLLIVKNGTEIGKLLLDDKPYHTFGRLPSCDITLEHPSISRYHAILQYRPNGMCSDIYVLGHAVILYMIMN